MSVREKGSARRVALVGVLSALSLMFLALSSLSPAARLGLVAVAGVVPAAAVVSAGLPAGFLCYAAAGLLGLLLISDKGNALLYLGFFGLYPMIKALIERLHNLLLEWGCKLAFFNLALSAGWFLLRGFLLAGLPEALGEAWALYLAGNLIFIAYDYGFSRLIGFYTWRVDRVLP